MIQTSLFYSLSLTLLPLNFGLLLNLSANHHPSLLSLLMAPLQSLTLIKLSVLITFSSDYNSSSPPPSLLPPSYSLLLVPALLHHNFIHFPCPILQLKPPPLYSIYSFHPQIFLHLPARTSSFQSSFFPSTTSLWNTLSSAPKESLYSYIVKSLVKSES